MFQQMFTGLKGEGPFGGNGATGVWRSFLTDEYAKSFAKSGGIGIADQVYSTLLSPTGGPSVTPSPKAPAPIATAAEAEQRHRQPECDHGSTGEHG